MDIRPGDALQAGAYLFGAAMFIAAMRISIAKLSVRQDHLERLVAGVVVDLGVAVGKITDAVIGMARYDERIRYLRRDLEEIKRREGFVRHPQPVPDEDVEDKN